MTYTVFGSQGRVGRSACHVSLEAALAEICRMERAGFAGVQVLRPYTNAVAASAFVDAHALAAEQRCGACARSCDVARLSP